MNARELHDKLIGDKSIQASGSEDWPTILRALDLLARVEEGEDELVRGLKAGAMLSGSRTVASYLDRSAAAIVALKAKRDRLKAHAEAMANGVEGKVYYADAPDVCEAVDAYRRDFPKDAP